MKPLGASRQFYCMSKAALDMHTKCLAESAAPNGVRVNSVNPGTVKSTIHARLGPLQLPLLPCFLHGWNCGPWDCPGMSGEATEAFMKERAAMTPMRRVGEGQDVADAVAFLASDQVSRRPPPRRAQKVDTRPGVLRHGRTSGRRRGLQCPRLR